MDRLTSLYMQALRSRADVFEFISAFDRSIADCKKAIAVHETQKEPDRKLTVRIILQLAGFVARNKNDYEAAENIIRHSLGLLDETGGRR
jgi:hypothetical protein